MLALLTDSKWFRLKAKFLRQNDFLKVLLILKKKKYQRNTNLPNLSVQYFKI